MRTTGRYSACSQLIDGEGRSGGGKKKKGLTEGKKGDRNSVKEAKGQKTLQQTEGIRQCDARKKEGGHQRSASRGQEMGKEKPEPVGGALSEFSAVEKDQFFLSVGICNQVF